jgi:hypothetical protein
MPKYNNSSSAVQRPITHSEKFRWIEAVLASRKYTDTQKNILVRLALYLNVETQRCDPSVATIAAGSGVTPRAANAALATARERGAIEVEFGGGRHRTNNYRVLLDWIHTEEILHDRAGFINPKPCTTEHETLHRQVRNPESPGKKPCTAIQTNMKNMENMNINRKVLDSNSHERQSEGEFDEVKESQSQISEGQTPSLPSSIPPPDVPRGPPSPELAAALKRFDAAFYGKPIPPKEGLPPGQVMARVQIVEVWPPALGPPGDDIFELDAVRYLQ